MQTGRSFAEWLQPHRSWSRMPPHSPHSTEPGAEAAEAALPTFDSFQLHCALLTGAVFGAVYPAAAVACVTVLGAFALSWHIAPHAQVGDVQVPRWLCSVSLLVFAASLWFVYGPWSMLGEGAATGVTVALAVVSVVAVGGAVWMQLSPAAQSRAVQAAHAAVASCTSRCRTPNNDVTTAGTAGDCKLLEEERIVD